MNKRSGSHTLDRILSRTHKQKTRLQLNTVTACGEWVTQDMQHTDASGIRSWQMEATFLIVEVKSSTCRIAQKIIEYKLMCSFLMFFSRKNPQYLDRCLVLGLQIVPEADS